MNTGTEATPKIFLTEGTLTTVINQITDAVRDRAGTMRLDSHTEAVQEFPPNGLQLTRYDTYVIVATTVRDDFEALLHVGWKVEIEVEPTVVRVYYYNSEGRRPHFTLTLSDS
jgi:hypothetical protein